MKILLSVSFLSLALLMGCAFGEGDSQNQQQELDNLNENLELFNSVQGVYQGTLNKDSGSSAVKVTLYYNTVKTGTTPKGEPIFNRVMRMKVDPEKDFNIYYLDQVRVYNNGEVQAANSSETTGTGFAFNGRIQGSQIIGQFDKDGPAGSISAEKTSLAVNASKQNRATELYEKTLRLMQPIQGIWSGTMIASDGKIVRVELNIAPEDQVVDGVSVLVPRAIFRLPEIDVDNAPTSRIITTASYVLDADPEFVAVSSKATGLNNVGYLSFKALKYGNTLKASVVRMNRLEYSNLSLNRN